MMTGQLQGASASGTSLEDRAAKTSTVRFDRKVPSAAECILEGRAGEARTGRFNVKGLMPERVNADISKRFDIDAKEIGSGGYGKVFVARDREMQDRKVAIKKVMVFDEEKKKAFQTEIAIMKELDHPNICKLLETYDCGRFMYFVMEFCEGREVFDRIMDNGQIDEKTTADIIRQSASALKYAHMRGIAHRDMKPENICFCTADPKDNQIKVIDWGLGFYFGQARMNSSVGSLTYAAPEVLESRESEGYTPACDLWSLGVVAYVMLCGKPPFWGNFAEQLRRMKKETYPMSDATWKAISRDAKDLIRGLLRANPTQRMSLDVVLSHPWLHNASMDMDATVSRQILDNMRNFSNTSQFFSLCVASVARQLDHRSLRDVHRVFCEMDTNGDGVLELSEVKVGFEKMFGKDSQELREVEAMFSRLDLDGSGQLDYTEFCAAGIGERLSTEERVLWAAFKAFDIQDDDGTISREEIKQVLQRTGVDKFWTNQVCEELSDELFSRYDKNGDGALDFPEFMKLMREIATRHRTPALDSACDEREAEFHQSLRAVTLAAQPPQELFHHAYKALVELDRSEMENSPHRRSASKPAIEGASPQSSNSRGRGGTRAVSGSLSAMRALQNNTPTCFQCSPSDDSNQRCALM